MVHKSKHPCPYHGKRESSLTMSVFHCPKQSMCQTVNVASIRLLWLLWQHSCQLAASVVILWIMWLKRSSLSAVFRSNNKCNYLSTILCFEFTCATCQLLVLWLWIMWLNVVRHSVWQCFDWKISDCFLTTISCFAFTYATRSVV